LSIIENDNSRDGDNLTENNNLEIDRVKKEENPLVKELDGDSHSSKKDESISEFFSIQSDDEEKSTSTQPKKIKETKKNHNYTEKRRRGKKMIQIR